MSDQSPRLSLPFILPAQAQKHVTHNEAIELLDLIVQLTLLSVSQVTPPATPQEGQAWAVPSGATGDWAGQDGLIATWRGGGWLFVAPQDGWVAWVGDAAGVHVLSGGVWTAQGDLQNLPGIGINSTADPVNRLSLRAPGPVRQRRRGPPDQDQQGDRCRYRGGAVPDWLWRAG